MPNSKLWWVDHLQRPNRFLMHIVPHNTQDLASLGDAATSLGFAICCINGEKINSKESLLNAIARSMKFPSYFGKNWDALEDLINDLSWWDVKGFLLIFEQADSFAHSSISEFLVFFEIFLNAIESWHMKDIPFYGVITYNDDSVANKFLIGEKRSICFH